MIGIVVSTAVVIGNSVGFLDVARKVGKDIVYLIVAAISLEMMEASGNLGGCLDQTNILAVLQEERDLLAVGQCVEVTRGNAGIRRRVHFLCKDHALNHAGHLTHMVGVDIEEGNGSGGILVQEIGSRYNTGTGALSNTVHTACRLVGR